ncbi:MAG TPA: ABC transporter permease, partial [Elusimicrobiota bacterium]|nr:ABC transporter permease [Elusimicrobiota bacterium]
MPDLLALAWRNLWRNRKRSLLTASSIAAGLAALMFGQSFIRSFQRQMIDKSTGAILGHLQVQARGVQDHKIPDVLLRAPERFVRLLSGDPRVAAAGARLLFTGLVYSAGGSRGVLVCGVEPERERALSIIPGYLSEGRYLEGPRDIVLGAKLAAELDARLGERLVVMAQRPGGEMGSELFRLAGILRTNSSTYDRDVAYIPLSAAQSVRGRPDQASHVAVRLTDPFLADAVRAAHAGELGDPGVELLTYEEVGSEIVGIKRFQDGVLAVVMAILFTIIGLGILNTLSMSFYERIREFGVLRAVGARPSRVAALMLLEAGFLGLVGTVVGLA